MSFNVGDKVTHSINGEGEIVYGPFTYKGSSSRYVVRYPDGSATGGEDFLTLRPAFSVGDIARHPADGVNVTVKFGPFTTAVSADRYLVELPDGNMCILPSSSMAATAPVTPAVGGRVRITECASWRTDGEGQTGTLIEIDPDDFDGHFRVMLDEGRAVWAHSVEKI